MLKILHRLILKLVIIHRAFLVSHVLFGWHVDIVFDEWRAHGVATGLTWMDVEGLRRLACWELSISGTKART